MIGSQFIEYILRFEIFRYVNKKTNKKTQMELYVSENVFSAANELFIEGTCWKTSTKTELQS